MSTAEQFTGADLGEGNYVIGALVVLSASGDSLVVSADTGDALTWSADLITADDGFNVTGNWADTGKLPCLSVTVGEDALVGCAGR